MNAIDFHKKHNYFINITNLAPADSAIQVCFPKNIFKGLPEKNISIFTDEENIVVLYETKEIQTKEIQLPEYCHRPFLMKEIVFEATARGITVDLIDINKVFSYIKDPKNRRKEKKLIGALVRFMEDNDLEESLEKDIELVMKETIFENFIN